MSTRHKQHRHRSVTGSGTQSNRCCRAISDLEEEHEVAIDLLVLPVLSLGRRELGPRLGRDEESRRVVALVTRTALVYVASVGRLEERLNARTARSSNSGTWRQRNECERVEKRC